MQDGVMILIELQPSRNIPVKPRVYPIAGLPCVLVAIYTTEELKRNKRLQPSRCLQWLSIYMWPFEP
eukprot:6484936-Amphidinium_carterae.1